MKKVLVALISLFCLDTFAWPFFFTEAPRPEKPPFTIIIDPAGDARTPGRTIDDTYERSLTMQCAEELKRLLEVDPKKCRVILTRFPGEIVEPFQKMTFANRLSVDLYVSLGFFQQSSESPELFLFTLLYDPATDFTARKSTALELLGYDQAYKLSLSTSKQYSTTAANRCTELAKSFHALCHAPRALPYKPLIGIMSPALGIEVGISTKGQAKELTTLIAKTLEAIFIA